MQSVPAVCSEPGLPWLHDVTWGMLPGTPWIHREFDFELIFGHRTSRSFLLLPDFSHSTLTFGYKTPIWNHDPWLKIFALNHLVEAIYSQSMFYAMLPWVRLQIGSELSTEIQLGSKSQAEQLPFAAHSCLEPCGPMSQEGGNHS